MLKGLNIQTGGKPKPVVIPPSREAEQIVREETHEADRMIAESDAILDKTPGDVKIADPDEINISGESKLSRLIDDDFPFDESQIEAVSGLVQQQYGCMIGAAGTGKTTVTKKLVDMLQDGVNQIDLSGYWKRGTPEDGDDYEVPEHYIPSICMVSYTGRASQMIKKNFPRDWHSNVMTIHRMLGFYPEFYMDNDAETGELVNKRRFVPSYDVDNQVPWDIIIIDEAGMLGLELWHQLWAATPSTTRIYMIGDINQLPPTHGKPILGFALASWPTWELTHVHRQQGENNSIVDNAHRILRGHRPIPDHSEPLSFTSPQNMVKALKWMANDHTWRFAQIDIDQEHKVAAIRIRQALKLLQGNLYEPNRDVVITPINGFEQTAPGYSLGQAPMNQELVTQLNHDAVRYLIDAGRERQNFAVGDKVMATINDYEAGITNGMTGIVTGITENGAYVGDTNRWGPIGKVNEYIAGLGDDEDEDVDFSLEDMVSDSQAGVDEMKKKEKRDSGPASHVVTVEFGEGEHAFEISFGSKSQVASLMLAYVATCHKMQGGEAPLVFVICHQQNKRPLNREWLYTAVTRASHRIVLLSTRQGLGFALGKQNIKGATLQAKVQSFAALTETGLLGPTVRVKLPQARSLVENASLPTLVVDRVPQRELRGERIEPQAPGPEVRHRIIQETVIRTIFERREPAPKPPARVIDGGELTPEKPAHQVHVLPAPPKPHPQWGAIHMQLALTHGYECGPKLLTYQPKPEPLNRLAALIKKQKGAT